MSSSLDDMGVVRSVPSRVDGRESVSATIALHVGQKEAQGEWIAGPTECSTVCSHVRHDPSIIGDSVEPSDVELHAAQSVAQDVHIVASGAPSAPIVHSAPAIPMADGPCAAQSSDSILQPGVPIGVKQALSTCIGQTPIGDRSHSSPMNEDRGGCNASELSKEDLGGID